MDARSHLRGLEGAARARPRTLRATRERRADAVRPEIAGGRCRARSLYRRRGAIRGRGGISESGAARRIADDHRGARPPDRVAQRLHRRPRASARRAWRRENARRGQASGSGERAVHPRPAGAGNAGHPGADAHALRARDHGRRADVAIFLGRIEGRQVVVSRREDSEKQEKGEQKGKDVKADARATAAEAETAGGATEEAAAKEIERLAAEKSDLKNTLLRLQADFDNYRKRTERERHQERHRGAETIVEHLLPVLDAFDRAISSHRDAAHDEHRKGFELIRKQLFDVLAKQGLQRIETAGKRFDPHVHHAIERIETTGEPDGAVLEELQAGYEFHGKVLRPAMVRVAVNPQSQDSESKTTVN